jgi:hypothetical protein
MMMMHHSWNIYQYISVQKQRLDLPYIPIRVKILRERKDVSNVQSCWEYGLSCWRCCCKGDGIGLWLLMRVAERG